jgi:hypothetical protein
MPIGRGLIGVDHVCNRQELRWFISQRIHTYDTPSTAEFGYTTASLGKREE